ncbi:sugar nucleotide-binding protein [Altererythrobacter confluentis]|uniref:dTDP-4-dehydrorhamnose reductase n=1 Tax=Allopontixanthobacter confluentis TaxID=1849021 RepID=A0A6L7GGU5_9SPHN|nr:SDR family oxidoreductase [Allopontixanthobacter confluentis]MXP15149.1 sugar nucleotide-binding protein [Allopontixanthobacter confluentis]
MRILVLGASGMLGNAVMRIFVQDPGTCVFGTVRSASSAKFFDADLAPQFIPHIDVERFEDLIAAMNIARPDVIINCIGVVKQLSDANDPLVALPINSLLPHRLARLAAVGGARLIHMSTDCVFSGNKGLYTEDDAPDAYDLYGRSKLLGEVDYPNAITLRTSIIGHELAGSRSLLNWFLAQEGEVKGFGKAIFSGLPTVEMARIIRDYVIPNAGLSGVYHVSAAPIDKLALLQLIAQTYNKTITIIPSDDLVIDRSLDSSRFHAATGYSPLPWPALVAEMESFR